jgi:glyoxylase-like metal-dependent hydrolase (beta-lactamase superfamily II)
MAGRCCFWNTIMYARVLQSVRNALSFGMLREERHDDVTRLVFESWPSRSMSFSVSVYAVRGVIIDTAFPGVRGDLNAWIDAHPPAGAIVTHYHEDHAGNVESMAARGLPLWIMPETLAKVRAPDPILAYRRWCWGSQPALVSPVIPFSHPAFEMIHTPGHSSEHHVVWDAGRETVFGADLFLGVRVRVTHPWPREDVRAQIASIRKVIALSPKRYFDAHRGLVPDPVAQLTAKADWTEETVGKIDALIERGMPDREIVKTLFRREDKWSFVTQYDYSRRNYVASVRATRGTR